MSVKTIQTTFSGGMINQDSEGRKDLDVYGKSARSIKNCYVSSVGFAFRREGEAYIDTTTTSQAGRLIDFEFSSTETYELLFTAGEMKVYKADVLVATVTTSPISTLTAAQIQEMDYLQLADTVLLYHSDFNIKIIRSSDTVWTPSAVTYTNIPYYAYGALTTTSPAATLTYTSASGKTKLTLGAAVGASTWVGQYIYLDKGGVLQVYQYDSTTVLWGNWKVEPPETTVVASGEWDLETGYEPLISSTKGYPSCACFGKGRLWLGGVKSAPTQLIGSQVDDYFNLDVGTGLDSDAIVYPVIKGKQDKIKFIIYQTTLQIFTQSSEWYVPISTTNTITPSNFVVQPSSDNGCSCKPVILDGNTLFTDREGLVVRQFVYDDLRQNFSAPNLSLLSSDLIKTVKKIVSRKPYSGNPNAIAYFLNTDGTITVLNLLSEQEFKAFSYFETDGLYEDISELNGDIYLLVKRTINGSTVRFLEKLDYDYYLDASKLQTSATKKTSWTGLAHLNGELCSVIGDEFVLDDETPATAAITSSLPVLKCEVGLPFFAEIESLPIDFEKNKISTIGDKKRLVYANIRMADSRNLLMTITQENGTITRYTIPFRKFGANVLDKQAALFSGWKKVFLNGYARDITFKITQEQPLEFKILCVEIGVQ